MINSAPQPAEQVTLVIPFGGTDVVRALLAVLLVGSFPVVLFVADPSSTMVKTYTDAVSAIVAFYFAARSAEGGQLEVASHVTRGS
jgi:hypothetical protein